MLKQHEMLPVFRFCVLDGCLVVLFDAFRKVLLDLGFCSDKFLLEIIFGESGLLALLFGMTTARNAVRFFSSGFLAVSPGLLGGCALKVLLD